MTDAATQFNPFDMSKVDGKPSIISGYCAKAQASGHYNCIWICFQEHNKFRAKDISIDIDASTFELGQLTRHCGLWRRLSMYSVVGIRQVEMEFHCLASDNKIYVFLSPVDHTQEVRQIDEEINHLQSCINQRGVCGVSSEGKVHGAEEQCPNVIWDEDDGIFCPVQAIYRQKCLRDKLRNAPAALNFYWATRKSPIPVATLKEVGFVNTYKNLQTLHFYDAMKPYGQSVKAIELVQGWHRTYITILFASGLLLSVIVTALTALATHDLECGWAAGSYSAAIIAVFLAFFALLSGIV